MTTLLAEQPIIVSLMLGALAAGLVYGWMQTGKAAAGIAGLIMLLLIPLAWLLASYWVTDREQIELLIERTAVAVAANEHEQVLAVIGDPRAEAQARAELPNYQFDEARVTGIREIVILDDTYPLEAEADLNVRVDVSHRGGRFRNVRAPRRLILTLQKQNEEWKVIAYEHLPVVGGPDQFSTGFPQQR